MRKAVIDLGTNTFNLLIVDDNDGKLTTIYHEKEGVALGMGGINTNSISSEAMLRGLKTFERFKSICDKNSVSNIKAIGTSALRAASNSSEFIDKCKKLTGIAIEIISGEREAEYIFEGVRSTFDFQSPALIMDIGGGSTEFILADKAGLVKSESFEIGVSRIYQKFSFSDPLSKNDISTIHNYLDEHLDTFFDQLKINTLIGASGSFETFYELIFDKDFPQFGEAKPISCISFMNCISTIIKSTLAERNSNERIIPIRKIMAPIAAVKIEYILKKIGATEIFVSYCSLKEGVLKSF